jgi:hypothetical protein
MCQQKTSTFPNAWKPDGLCVPELYPVQASGKIKPKKSDPETQFPGGAVTLDRRFDQAARMIQ